MKNEKIINAWDKMKPSEETKNQIFNEISAGKHKNRKKFHKIRYVLTAAFLVIALSMLSGFGVEIITKIFNLVNNSNIDTGMGYYYTPDPDIMALETGTNGTYNPVSLETIEESLAYLAFTPKTLNYLPEGYSFKYIRVYKHEEYEIYQNMNCDITYTIENGDSEKYEIILSQHYVGNISMINIDTALNSTIITLGGDIEALLTNWKSTYKLKWYKDGILYDLNGFGKDELIKMAESVG